MPLTGDWDSLGQESYVLLMKTLSGGTGVRVFCFVLFCFVLFCFVLFCFVGKVDGSSDFMGALPESKGFFCTKHEEDRW